MLGCFCPCHGCIDNAIHTYSGVQLRAECARIMEGQGHEEKTGTGNYWHPVTVPVCSWRKKKSWKVWYLMFLRTRTTTSTEGFSQIDGNVQTERLKQALQKAEAVIIGAGAGLSTSAGFTYSGERFEKWFGDFRQVHGFSDMYSGGFFPYKTLEEYWAYWSRYIYMQPGRMQFMPA